MLAQDRSPRLTGWRPDLKRSVRLLREFRYEQPDPDRFYSAIARDSAAQLSAYVDLDGLVMLDVGGGPGYFRDAFEDAGATYLALDADAGELAGLGRGVPPGHASGHLGGRTVIGSGTSLPFADSSLDVTYSSNVLEHVAAPWAMADEMLRVTRPGGTMLLSYTTWYGPWGGHETSPWHFLGGRRARRRYAAKHGREPKNKYGESLFAVTVRDGLGWVDRQDSAEVVAVFPRYNPRWSWWLLRVPVLRELVTWNLVVVLRKR